MDTVVLTFQAPDPGKVLPGLQEVLDAQGCAKLYQAFLEDALEYTQEMGIKRIVACHPTINHPYFQALSKRVYIEMAEHSGTTPGSRIQSALAIGFQKGAQKVLLWDGFSPTFSGKVFKEGFARLEKADLVVGPAMDYGTYLIGAKAGTATDYFEKVKWDSPGEFSGLVHWAEAGKLVVHVHPVWHRLRRKEDLPYFMFSLNQQVRQFPRIARHTRKALEELNLR